MEGRSCGRVPAQAPTKGVAVIMRPAVILLSGGLDSATVLAIARNEGYVPNVLTFRYGQRHDVEVAAARRVADALGVERHVVVDIDLRQFGASALTDDIAVPHHERV